MESYEQKRAHALQLANRRRTGGKLSFLAHWARIIIVSLALFVVIRAFGVEAKRSILLRKQKRLLAML